MTDTVRTRSYLSGTSFASSKSGGITAQDIRDFLASVYLEGDDPIFGSVVTSIYSSGDQVIAFQYDPTINGTVGTSAGDNGGTKWGMVGQSGQFNNGPTGETTYTDDTFHIGMNVGDQTGGVGRADTSKANMVLSWESKYAISEVFGQEFHLQGVTPDGLTTWRPFSFFVADDLSSISGNFDATEFAFRNGSGTSILDLQLASGYGEIQNSFILRAGVNNYAFFSQLNAAGNGYLNLPYFNGSDQLAVTGQIISNAASPGAGSDGHSFNFTGAPGAGSTLFSVIASSSAGNSTLNGFNLSASTNYDFQNVLLNLNSTTQYSSAVQSMQTAASNGMAYMRVGYQSGQQWSFGMKNTQNFVLSAASNLLSSEIFNVDKTNLNLAFDKPPKLPSYAVASLPSASTYGAGSMIYVSDETGGAVVAFSDGTNWLRVTDRATVS